MAPICEICCMSILVVSATALEIAPFVAKFPHVDTFVHGVGASPAVFSLTRKLSSTKFSLVIQAGIAGSFDESLPPGELLVVRRDRFADVGVMENGCISTVFEMGLADANAFPHSSGWLTNKSELLDKLSFKKVDAITINLLSNDANYTTAFQQKFGAAIETMEGAALHYVCLQLGIPFLQLRAVSNRVGERDKENWKIQEAMEAVCEGLGRVVER